MREENCIIKAVLRKPTLNNHYCKKHPTFRLEKRVFQTAGAIDVKIICPACEIENENYQDSRLRLNFNYERVKLTEKAQSRHIKKVTVSP